MNSVVTHSPAGARRRLQPVAILVALVTYLVLLVGLVIFLFPFYNMVIGSFKGTNEIMTSQLRLLPKVWMFSNLSELFRRVPFQRNLLNTLFVAVTSTALSLFLCALGGFVFAKLRFPGRDILLMIMLSTMMIPGQVTLVPLFIIMNRLNWLDTFYPLIIPGAANAFGIFLMRQYSTAIPDELIDAARIDGCTTFRIFRSVAAPILKPALTVVGLIFFMSSWNDFLWPLIVLKSMDRYTVPVALSSLIGQGYVIPYGVILAGATISSLPLAILFLVFQRGFVSGILAGAVKG
jgi:ABC-type glycerol-3-phosphate transport system permease component